MVANTKPSALPWALLLFSGFFATSAAYVCSTGTFGPSCTRGNNAWFVGCFNDGLTPRDLSTVAPVANASLLTAPLCTVLCAQQGFMYAAVQAGSLCFCGDSYGRYGSAGSSRCRAYTCSGDSTQYCGGLLASAIFRTAFYVAPPVVSIDTLQAYSAAQLTASAATAAVSPSYSWDINGAEYSEDTISYWFGAPGPVVVTVTADNNVISATTSITLQVLGPVLATVPNSVAAAAGGAVSIPLRLDQGTDVTASVFLLGTRLTTTLLPDTLHQRLGPDGSFSLISASSPVADGAVVLLAGQPVTAAGVLEAIELRLVEADSVTVSLFRPVCNTTSLRYCRWTSTCTLPSACTPPSVSCNSGTALCPTLGSCIAPDADCPADVPATVPLWQQATQVWSTVLQVTVASPFAAQYVPISPVPVEIGDIFGVTASPALVWGQTSSPSYVGVYGAAAVTALADTSATPWIAGHVAVSVNAVLSVNLTESALLTVSLSNNLSAINPTVAVSVIPALTMLSIQLVSDQPLGLPVLLSVATPGISSAELNVTWSVSSVTSSTGELVVVNASHAHLTCAVAGRYNITALVCSHFTCLTAGYSYDAAASLANLAVSTPTFAVALGSPSTLLISPSLASLATCTVSVNAVNTTVVFDANSTAINFSFVVSSPGVFTARVSCVNKFSTAALVQTVPLAIIGSQDNFSATVVNRADVVSAGSTATFVVSVVGASAANCSIAFLLRNATATAPVFAAGLSFSVPAVNAGLTWGTLLLQGPSTLLALPVSILGVQLLQWATQPSKSTIIAVGQSSGLVPVLSAGALPFDSAISFGNGVTITNASLACVQASSSCAAALAACPNVSDCHCVVTCPQCACSWTPSNMAALESLLTCTATLSCALSQYVYPSVGSFLLNISVANAVSRLNGSIAVQTQRSIGPVVIVGPSVIALGSNATFTANVTAGSDVKLRWTVNGTAAGWGPTLVWNCSSEGSVVIGLVASNNISSQSSQRTMAVQGLAALLSLSCPSSVTRGSSVTCTATAAGLYLATVAWSLNGSPFGDSSLSQTFPLTSVQIATVRLVVSNAFGQSSLTTKIDVQDPITFLSISAPTVSLGSVSTLTPVLDGSSVKCSWTFGDVVAYRADPIFTDNSASLQHKYAAAGAFNATVTCQNKISERSSAALVVVSDPDSPLLILGPLLVYTGSNVAFCVTNRGNLLAIESAAQVTWTATAQSAQSGGCVNYTFSSAGLVLLSASVSTANVMRSVLIQDPISSLQLQGPTAIAVGTDFVVTAVTGSGSLLAYQWSTDVGALSVANTSAQVSVRVTSTLTRTVSVTVSNLIDVVRASIDVIVQVPISGFALSTPTVVPTNTNFTVTATAGTGTGLTFAWILPSGALPANSSPDQVLLFSSPAVYNVSLRIANALGSLVLPTTIQAVNVLSTSPLFFSPPAFLATNSTTNLTLVLPSGSDFIVTVTNGRNGTIFSASFAAAQLITFPFTPTVAGIDNLTAVFANGLGRVTAAMTVAVQDTLRGARLVGPTTILTTTSLSYQVFFDSGSSVSVASSACQGSCVTDPSVAATSSWTKSFGHFAAGTASLSFTVSNAVSQQVLIVYVVVREAISVNCQLTSAILPTGGATSLSATFLTGTAFGIAINWGDGQTSNSGPYSIPAAPSFPHTFTSAGNYTVALQASNEVSTAACTNNTIAVYNPLAGLTLTAPRFVAAFQLFNIVANITAGSSTSFTLRVGGVGFPITTANLLSAVWTLSLPAQGDYSIQVVAQNPVSTLSLSGNLQAQMALTSAYAITVRGPCPTNATARCILTSPFAHQASVSFEISAPAWLASATILPRDALQTITSPSAISTSVFPFARLLATPGSFTASVFLANNISNATVSLPFVVLPNLLTAKMVSLPPTLVNTSVVFTAVVMTSSTPFNATYVWNFGDGGSSVTVASSAIVAHTYTATGVYTVSVLVSNALGSVSATLRHIVQAQVCLPPVIVVGELGATFRYGRADGFHMHGTVVYNCSNFTALNQRWTVYQVSSDPATAATAGIWADNGTDLSAKFPLVATGAGAALDIDANQLALGVYIFQLTATLNGSVPLIDKVQSVVVAIVSLPIVAQISGKPDSSLAWSKSGDAPLVIDASSTYDPDGTSAVASMVFTWSCSSLVYPTNCTGLANANQIIAASAGSCFSGSSGSALLSLSVSAVLSIPSSLLRTDRSVFVFSVAVVRGIQSSQSRRGNQSPPCDSFSSCRARVVVTAYSSPLLSASIAGLDGAVNRNDRIILSAVCASCSSKTGLTYQWSLDTAGCAALPVGITALDDITLTGTTSSMLVLAPNTLPASGLRISLQVTDTSRGQSGTSSVLVSTRDPPSGGVCSVVDQFGDAITRGTELTTLFSITCVNWSSSSNARGTLANSPGLVFSFAAVETGGLQHVLGGGLGIASVSKYLSRKAVGIEVQVTDNFGASTIVLLAVTVSALQGKPDTNANSLFTGPYAELVNSGDRDGQRAMAMTIASSFNAAPLGSANSTQAERAARRQIRAKFLADLASSSTSSTVDDLAGGASVLTTVLGGSAPDASSVDASLLVSGAEILHTLSRGASDGAAGDAVYSNLLQAAANVMTMLNTLYVTSPASGASASAMVVSSSESLAAGILADAVAEEPAFTYISGGVSFQFARENSNSTQVTASGGASFKLPTSALTAVGGDFLSNLQVYTDNPYAVNGTQIQTGVVALVLQNGTTGSAIPMANLPDTFLIHLPVTTQPTTPNVTTVDGGKTTRHRVTHGANCSQCATHIMIQPTMGTAINLTVTLQFDNATGAQVGLNLTALYTADTVRSFTLLVPPTQSSLSLAAYYAASDSLATVLTGSTGLDIFGKQGGYTVLITNNAPSNVSYRFVVFETECGFWNETSSDWSTTGCTASAYARTDLLACRCNHLTAFGSRVVVVPNYVDPLDVSLFSSLEDNAVVFSVVVLVWALYIVGLIYAHRADKRDECLVGPINLPENRPMHQAAYEVVVITGARPNAGTTSNVYVQMTGVFGQSTARQLHHPWRPVFTRNAVDTFYMTLPASLGPLQRLRVWHDHADDSADATWFLKRIRVTDMQTGEMWYFPCSRWLALELDDGLVERTLEAVPVEDMDTFRTAFGDHVSNGFSDNHIWLSIFSRPPQSRFTRKQRLTCVLCLLLLTMFTSVMFYKQDTTQRTFEQEIFVGVVSSLIIFPIIFIFINLFRRSRNVVKAGDEAQPLDPHGSGTSLSPSSVELSLHTVGSGAAPNPLHPTNLKQASETELWSSLFRLQHSRTDEDTGLGKDTAIYAEYSDDEHSHDASDEPLDGLDDEDERESEPLSFPPWMRYVTWGLIIFTNVFVSYWVILYGLSFGASTSWAWLRSLVSALFTSIFLLQPLQVLVLAMVVAYIYRRHEDRDRPDDDFDDDEELAARNTGLVSELRRRRRMYRPRRHRRRPADVRLQRARRLQEIKMARVFKEGLLYLFFFWLLCVVVYAEFDREVPLFADAIRNTLGAGVIAQANVNGTSTENFNNVAFVADWWAWARTGLLPRLFWDTQYNGQSTNTNSYIADGMAVLVGGVQLRQLRVGSHSCDIVSTMTSLVDDCFAAWTPGTNDHSRMYLVNSSTGQRDTGGLYWDYRTDKETGMHDYVADQTSYYGSGFTQLLPSTHAGGIALLDTLSAGQWTDQQTRVVFVELSLYNPNANLFAAVQLVAEFLESGAVQTWTLVAPMRLFRYLGPKGSFQMACEILFVLVLLYYSALEVQKIYRAKLTYFTAYRNVLEFVILGLALFCFAFDLFRIVFVQQSMSGFVNAGRQVFASQFHWLAYWDRTVRLLQAVLLFFATLKFLVVLRHNKVFSLMVHTLRTAMIFLHSFLVVVVVAWMGFVVWGYISFGSEVQSFSTIPDTMYTLWRLSLGDFTFNDFEQANRVVGPIYFVLYSFFFYILIMNIFIAVISEAFSRTKKGVRPETGLTLAEYVLGKIRWYTGMSLGRPPKPKRRESVGAMCDEAVKKMDEIEGRLELLLRTAASPPGTALPSLPSSPAATLRRPPLPPIPIAIALLAARRSVRRSKNSKSKPSSSAAAAAAAVAVVGGMAPSGGVTKKRAVVAAVGGGVRPMPTAGDLRVFARSNTDQSLPGSGAAAAASSPLTRMSSLREDDSVLFSNAEL